MMIPALLSQSELSTAMPKSGGTYFYIDRSLGPLLGSFAGFANWFSISLKGAFALIGIGAFIQIFYHEVSLFQIKLIALGFILVFTIINLVSTKETGHIQDFMVFVLIAILIFYIFFGTGKTNHNNFIPLIVSGWDPLIKVAGMVFISYGGLTKVASLAGEIKNPGKTLPRGMFLSYMVVNILYLISIIVTVGLLSAEEINSTYTPLTMAAGKILGKPGMILLSIAAIFSFATTANASILSSSRMPVAMSRDSLLPKFFSYTTKKHEVPVPAILITSLFMGGVIMGLNLENLVKTASTMMLILFLLVNLSVILMRESKIVSYRPLYKTPFYPFVQIIGMIFSIILIFKMGNLPLILTGCFFVFSAFWYLIFRRGKPRRDSALIRIVERVAAREIQGSRLHEELTGILRERDNINEDRFDHLIRKAIILDFDKPMNKDELFEKIASAFSLRLDLNWDIILKKLREREDDSSTVISNDLAIPHIVVETDHDFEILVIRCRKGIFFSETHPEVKIIFSLAGSKKERNFHLKALMAIAQIVQSEDFTKKWEQAIDEEELRHLILLSERKR